MEKIGGISKYFNRVMLNIFKYIICIFIFCGAVFASLQLDATSANAANLYVRAGATGSQNGSDWSNAYPLLPSTLIRGNTYYIGSGSYGSYSFDDAASGSTKIYIKKATAFDHGTEVGWQSSYGVGQATFTSWTFLSAYWDINGGTGGGPGSWETNFGMRIKTSGAGAKAIRINVKPSYITIAHVDIENSGEDVGGSGDTIYTVGSSNVTISHCWVHNTNRTNFLINGSQNWTIEYSLISDKHNTDATHGEHLSANGNGMNANHVYRYNIWRDAGGANTGVIVIKDSVQSGWKIYGNLFYVTDSSRYRVTNGIITDSTGDSTTDVKIYNNTFMPILGINGPAQTVSFDVSTNNEFKNNIVFGSGGFAGISRSNNLYDSSSFASGETGGQYFSSGGTALFANPGSYNYSLKVATNRGDGLIGAEYQADMLGVTRGGDGVLDRGAFEFQDGNPPPPVAIPMQPSNLQIQ
jgi:hypothetical protein